MGSDHNKCCGSKQFRKEEFENELNADYEYFSNSPSKRTTNLTNINAKISTKIIKKYCTSNSIKKITLLQSHIRKLLLRKKLEHDNKKLLKLLLTNKKPKNYFSKNKCEILFNDFKNKYPNELINFPPQKKNKLITLTIDNYLINKNPNEYYTGSFNIKNQLYHGFGTLYIKNKNSINLFQGIFNNGKLENLAYALYSKNSVIYIGSFKNNFRNGAGKEIYLGTQEKNFSKFGGIYLNDNKLNGTFYWKDGSFYCGGINNNEKFNGKGKYFWKKTNEIYEGEWYNGQMCGNGKMVYSDGSIYEGNFFENKKNGLGVYTWGEGGKCYVGEWKNDLMDGNGKFLNGDKLIVGIWKEGKFIDNKNNFDTNYTTNNVIKVNNINEKNDNEKINKTLNDLSLETGPYIKKRAKDIFKDKIFKTGNTTYRDNSLNSDYREHFYNTVKDYNFVYRKKLNK